MQLRAVAFLYKKRLKIESWRRKIGKIFNFCKEGNLSFSVYHINFTDIIIEFDAQKN